MARVISKSTVFPAQKSNLPPLKLSVPDLMMLSMQYIQMGGLFPSPPLPIPQMLSYLKTSLSQTLMHYPPLAGRLTTDSDGYIYVTCSDAGVDFIHADASDISVSDLIGNGPPDVLDAVMSCCFAFEGIGNYEGHFRPLLAVQVTELDGGFFIGFSVNHSVVDGTCCSNVLHSFMELSCGMKKISRTPVFSLESLLIPKVALRIPAGGVPIAFPIDAPIRDRIFSFSRESILKLKTRINGQLGTIEISSLQCLGALIWRGITRARKLPPSKMTRMSVVANFRDRLEPKLDAYYFGNAIQIVPTDATAGELLERDLHWSAEQLNKSLMGYDSTMAKKFIENSEHNPMLLAGNFDGTGIYITSSPRFPMYDDHTGWGRPLAVWSGKTNKYDGKVNVHPGREGNGSLELEVILAPETMASLESDMEFMQYVSTTYQFKRKCCVYSKI